MKFNKIPVSALLLLLIAIVAIIMSFAFLKKNELNKPSSSNTQEKIITLTNAGFSPNSISISPGTRVVWINKTQAQATVNSDDYPSSTKFPFLNLGPFDSGSNLQVILDKPGTFTYHNQSNPTQKGTIIVSK